jgi:DNA helicase HerA-like ATPase
VRLLELGVSAVIDLSELGPDRPAYVAKFLDAMINAPRELWHAVLVVVDEAHRLCPEKGRARKQEERKAIEDSSTR